jgi:hypothetical protein
MRKRVVGGWTQTGVVVPFPRAAIKRRARPKAALGFGCLVFAIVFLLLLAQLVFYLFCLPRLDRNRQQLFFDLLSAPAVIGAPG